ncbi:neo-calmodulin-like [Ruditapes philippinarum]|uniref:neo-calmodulin-like n=1 Tax=Ruditapes philippinarum TaxID=129788 RepID=UPI00295B33C9|nr:neo-calmodulin-like [Ruditapes philippinarum]
MSDDTLSPEQFLELREKEVFDLFDTNGDGFITQNELGNVLRCIGYNPTGAEVEDILKKFDSDHNNKITYDEYVEMLKKHLKDPSTFNVELREAFRKFDRDRTGDLDFKELRKALMSLGEPLTAEETDQLFKMMDADGDKQVDVEEFVMFMLKGYDEIKKVEECSQVQLSSSKK